MDFSYGNTWGTDSISTSTPMNYDSSDLFVTQPKIGKVLQYPAVGQKYPNPVMEKKAIMPPSKTEGFVTDMRSPDISENMLIILLLVVLIVLCTMIYSTVKQTCETMKLMAAILAQR